MIIKKFALFHFLIILLVGAFLLGKLYFALTQVNALEKKLSSIRETMKDTYFPSPHSPPLKMAAAKFCSLFSQSIVYYPASNRFSYFIGEDEVSRGIFFIAKNYIISHSATENSYNKARILNHDKMGYISQLKSSTELFSIEKCHEY